MGMGWVSGLKPPTGNSPMPPSCRGWVYVIPPANLDDLQYQITPEVDIISQDRQMIGRAVLQMKPCWGPASFFPNHLLMQAGMQLSEILFLFVVLVSFRLSQLAQVLFYPTLLIRSCAVMHDKWFEKTATKRRRRSYLKSSCQNILYMLDN